LHCFGTRLTIKPHLACTELPFSQFSAADVSHKANDGVE